MPIVSPRSSRRRSTFFAAPVIAAAILTACGGSTAVESAADAAAAEATATAAQLAEQNMPDLQAADSAFDVEVLSVADGSISTLRDAVIGDRPVLVWFYSPH